MDAVMSDHGALSAATLAEVTRLVCQPNVEQEVSNETGSSLVPPPPQGPSAPSFSPADLAKRRLDAVQAVLLLAPRLRVPLVTTSSVIPQYLYSPPPASRTTPLGPNLPRWSKAVLPDPDNLRPELKVDPSAAMTVARPQSRPLKLRRASHSAEDLNVGGAEPEGGPAEDVDEIDDDNDLEEDGDETMVDIEAGGRRKGKEHSFE